MGRVEVPEVIEQKPPVVRHRQRPPPEPLRLAQPRIAVDPVEQPLHQRARPIEIALEPPPLEVELGHLRLERIAPTLLLPARRARLDEAFFERLLGALELKLRRPQPRIRLLQRRAMPLALLFEMLEAVDLVGDLVLDPHEILVDEERQRRPIHLDLGPDPREALGRRRIEVVGVHHRVQRPVDPLGIDELGIEAHRPSVIGAPGRVKTTAVCYNPRMSDDRKLPAAAAPDAPPAFGERLTAGAAPLRNALPRVEGDPLFQREMPREVRASAEKRLAGLEKLFAELQAEAQLVVGGARRDIELHQVPLSGTKLRGQSYHLFQATDGRRFFSLLGPDDYAQINPSHRHLGHYRLQHDGAWTRLDADDKDDRVAHAPPVRGPHFVFGEPEPADLPDVPDVPDPETDR